MSQTDTTGPVQGDSTYGTTYQQQQATAKAVADAALLAGFNTQHANITSSASDAAGNAGRTEYGAGILNFLDSLRSGQRTLDNQGANNELAKRQGTQGVLNMVGNGIRSGGVMLNNKNAGDSSAVGAIASAYGELGQRQLSQVGNQYAQGQNDIATAQANFQDQQTSGARNLGYGKEKIVNSIVTDAQNSLAALDGQMASAGIGDRINIEAEKQNIRNNALAQLQQYDQQLSQGQAGIHAAGADANRVEAARLAQAGIAATNPFQFTDQAPAQLQNSGPLPSQLPIYTSPRVKQQYA